MYVACMLQHVCGGYLSNDDDVDSLFTIDGNGDKQLIKQFIFSHVGYVQYFHTSFNLKLYLRCEECWGPQMIYMCIDFQKMNFRMY